MTGSLKPINIGGPVSCSSLTQPFFTSSGIDFIICIIYARYIFRRITLIGIFNNIIVLYIYITIGCHGLCETLIINQFWCSFLAHFGYFFGFRYLDFLEVKHLMLWLFDQPIKHALWHSDYQPVLVQLFGHFWVFLWL